MTEWNARECHERSALQKWLADRRLGDGSAADAAVFHFYQMRITLRRG